MRVVITGATGNVGTSLIRALENEPAVTSVLGLARRRAHLDLPKVEWARGDVSSDDLVPFFRGADAVVHLAWLIQPARDLRTLRLTNVDGSRRVLQAVAEAGVPALVHASSLGTYSPGPKDRMVDETWPNRGMPTSFYSRHKAEVEAMLDSFEQERPEVRVVRMRPALIFKREAAAEVRRLFIGPFLPGFLLRPSLIPLFPDVAGLTFQALHSYDAGEAYRLAIVSDARGPFNLAADPVLDMRAVARLLGARAVRIPRGALRPGAMLAWRLRLQPTPPGWVDMAFQVPLLDSTRARTVLAWRPRYTSTQALADLLAGLREGEGFPTPPLDPKAGGRFRIREAATGVGARPGLHGS